MAVFENCSVLLELKTLPFKERKKLKSSVTENGGNISYVVNKQCSLVVTNDVSDLSSNRLRCIQKYQTPVVGVEYVHRCLERGVLLHVDEYKLDTSSCPAFSPPLPPSSLWQSQLSSQVSKIPTSKAAAELTDSVSLTQTAETSERNYVLGKYRIYTETDPDVPSYLDNFQVAKYSIFEKVNSNSWCSLELQSYKVEKGRKYLVVRYWNDDILSKKWPVRDMLVPVSTSEEAVEVYQALRETLLATGLQLRNNIPLEGLGLVSVPLQQLLMEEKLNTGSISQEVGVFVELLWTEALGHLSNILRVSIDKLSLNDVSRAEGLLLQAQRKLKEANHTEMESLLVEVYTLLPQVVPHQFSLTAKHISQKLDLCQLIRDILNVREMTLRSPTPSCLGKYRALRCSIEMVPPGTSEFQKVTAQLLGSKVQVRQILRVCRGVELQMFKSEVGNIKELLHSSSPSNFVGVLSRGLLLPRVGEESHGIERTDVGNLGSGIYFSDAISTSLKYSKPSETDGSRLLLVCDVALGRCKDVHKRDFTLTQAPEGHHSVHGVRRTPSTPSEFEDDEYVVYSSDQVKLKYVVQFCMEGDQLKEFSPTIDTSAELCLPSSDQDLESMLEDDGVEGIKNPLADVTAGLLDSSGQQLPLQAVHVKCKLVDLLSQVIIFQKYSNLSSSPIEAKYVFPLDDSAAVCGFEAFINGKHVVGQVKEKETARKDYKRAIEKGHGAYLMDQDAPDVFTISVGNLPSGATVLIKVTFVSELIIRNGRILFSLPGSVAPWQESAALNQTTQVTVEKVCVTDEAREFTLDMSVEMPHEITNLQCITHNVKIKKTDCKAVVSVLPGQVIGQEGFQLSVTLSEVHLPRMWVEKHPDKDSQASMLVFYPDFEVSSTSASDEVVLLLDTSESMKGESLRMAQRIARQVFKTLDHNVKFNVIFFGTDHTGAFLTAQPLAEACATAESFIKLSPPVGGSTELWRPLQALSLLPPSCGVRNLLLLSDGHIQNAELTLKLLRDDVQHSRLFTCGLSPTANRHMLRALAQAGGGAYEFFDTKTKHNWAEKVARQVKRMTSPGCSSVSVKWQQFSPTALPPVQAPKQLHALFNDCHTLVYGFVPHCTQATLLGNLSGQEFKTMVSTSELQKTRGTFLHKLTARALIRDYEDGSLDSNEAEHEGKKAELKHFIIELSKEFSILSQFTSFVAIEERNSEQTEVGFTDIPKLIAEEDVDFLPYISWTSPQDKEEEESVDDEIMGKDDDKGEEYSLADSYIVMEEDEDREEESDDDMGFGLMGMDEGEEDESDHEMRFGLTEEDEDGEEESDHDMGFDLKEKDEREVEESEVVVPCGLMEEDEDREEESDHDMGFDLKAETCVTEDSHFSAMSTSSSLFGARAMRRSRRRPVCRMSIKERHIGHCLDEGLDMFPNALPPPPPPPPHPVLASQLCSSLLHKLVPPPPFSESTALSCAPHSPPTAPPSFDLQGQHEPPAARFLKGPLTTTTEVYKSGPLPQVQSLEQGLCMEAIKQAPPAGVGVQQQSSFGFSGSLLRDESLKRDICVEISKQARPEGFEFQPQSGVYNSLSLPQVQSRNQSLSTKRSKHPPSAGFAAQQQSSFGFSGTLPQVQSLEQDICVETSKQARPEGFEFQPQSSFGFSLALPKVQPLGLDLSIKPSKQAPPAVQQQVQQQVQRQSGFGFSGFQPQVQLLEKAHPGKDFIQIPVSEAKDLQQDLQILSADFPPAGFTFGAVRAQSEAAPAEHRSGIGHKKHRKARCPLRQGLPQPLSAKSSFKEHFYSLPSSAHQLFERKSADLEVLKRRWTEIFLMQHSKGYWELTTELGELMNVDVDLFANVFLKNKGIQSLGVRAHADILRLLATLLVLQLIRVEKLEEGKLLRTLFCLDDSSLPRPKRWEEVKKAVDWVCWADQQYPCVYSRLEFGLSWESSTRQLLGFDSFPPFSPLTGLNLQRAVPHLLVH